MSTEYVVLRNAEAENERSGPGSSYLSIVAEGVTATSANAAIKATATTSGAYVAVPLRSFKPVSVVVESKPSVQIGELA